MMTFKPVILWTDVVMWVLLLALGLACGASGVIRSCEPPGAVCLSGAAVASCVVLGTLLVVTMIDSLHFRRACLRWAVVACLCPINPYRVDADLALPNSLGSRESATRSPALATRFRWRNQPPQAGAKPKLTPWRTRAAKAPILAAKHGGAGLASPEQDWAGDVLARLACMAVWRGHGSGFIGVATRSAIQHQDTQAFGTLSLSTHWRASVGQFVRGSPPDQCGPLP